MLGKIFGGKGLLGGFFDKIGMSWMNNVLSLAANVMTGNWLAAAKDVFSLVSQFSNSWMNTVDRHQPLGPFGGRSSCFGGDSVLSQARLQDMQSRAGRSSDAVASRNVSRTISAVSYTVENNALADSNLRNAWTAARV